MTIALPDYLGKQDFNDCPPGHRFGLYFDGWTESFGIRRDGKTAVFKKVAEKLPPSSQQALAALRARQMAATRGQGETVLVYPAALTAPLATGLGNEHPLENGFAFLTPHGLPYLPGSGAKGAIRRAAEELASGEWGNTAGWTQEAIDNLFGPGEERLADKSATFRRGALAFWDVFFQPPKGQGALSVEIMTPHHAGYLQSSGSPHANEQPNPILFLAIPAGAQCHLIVQCNPALIQDASVLDHWKILLAAALDLAGEWLGFGAKAAVGYGRLAPDRKALAAAHEAERAQAEAQARELKAAQLGPRLLAVQDLAADCAAKAATGQRDKLNAGLHQRAQNLVKEALADGSPWLAEECAALARTLEDWLPKVIEKLDKKDDWKDARKKLQLARLKGEA